MLLSLYYSPAFPISTATLTEVSMKIHIIYKENVLGYSISVSYWNNHNQFNRLF